MATSDMSAAATGATGFVPMSDRRADPHSPYGLPIIDVCPRLQLRDNNFFCNLPRESIETLDHLKLIDCFPEGSVVFLEGQEARGIYILCQGRAKLITTNADGKSLILKIAEPGTIIGLHSAIRGRQHEVEEQFLEPGQYIARAIFT